MCIEILSREFDGFTRIYIQITWKISYSRDIHSVHIDKKNMR